jgi:hypothetical protein
MNRNRFPHAALFCFALCFVILLVGAAIHAQATPAPAPAGGVDWTAFAMTVIKIAAFVALVLQGLKSYFPAILQGVVAKIVSVVLAIALAYAAAPAGNVLTVQFALVTISAALGANGIYWFGKIFGGSSGNPPISSPPAAPVPPAIKN